MGLFDFFKKKNNDTDDFSSARYRGRWYGLMFCLGEKSGRDMKKILEDKAQEILTMLELSNEYPQDFEYVNKLMKLEDSKKPSDNKYSDSQLQAHYILGAVEAKSVYLRKESWDVLLEERKIS